MILSTGMPAVRADALSESQWLKRKRKTTTQMRTEIAEKIVGMDLSFIILLDDLDRLEPAQAVGRSSALVQICR